MSAEADGTGVTSTNAVTEGLQIGGMTNLFLATLLVWLGALIAGILIPIYVFKELRENRKQG